MYYNSPCEILKNERNSGFTLSHYIKDKNENILVLENSFKDKKIITLSKDNKIIHEEVKFFCTVE